MCVRARPSARWNTAAQVGQPQGPASRREAQPRERVVRRGASYGEERTYMVCVAPATPSHRHAQRHRHPQIRASRQ
jgi:hypothetical protein